MRRIGVYTLILIGLFYFSEGKPCPEKTRPHKTRCDAYYKCQDLPPKAHVWIPSICEQGLIYEHNLKLCVLPEEDWECILDDSMELVKYQQELSSNQIAASHENNAQVINTNKNSDIDIVSKERTDSIELRKVDNDSVQLVVDNSMSSEEENDDDNEYESSGNGESLMERNGFLKAENRETDDHVIEAEQDQREVTDTPMPTQSHIDPKLTAHLQRLSQLIDGLKHSYQSQGTKQNELRPDQLNAFLAHFNIKNKFNSLGPVVEYDSELPKMTTTTPIPSIGSTMSTRLNKLHVTSKNKTELQDQLSNKMKPETKLMLSSGMPKRYGNSGGYSSSQIVVNHPEGSVMFSLPPYGNEQHFVDNTHIYESQHSPKISEDTLKTVLELSKQMIAHQNVPKVIQNPAYYPQTILQPLYLPANTFPSTHGSPFSSYYNHNNNQHNHQHSNNNDNNDYDTDDNRYPSAASNQNYKPHGHKQGHQGHKKHGQHANNAYSKPSTTIIHNNVIPVHVTPTNSGEKEVIDSYGQSLGHYPPLNGGESGNNGYTQHQQHISHRFDGNMFVSSISTGHPHTDYTTPASVYSGQYPSPYSTEISVTTVRPFQFQPTPEYFTPSQHLGEHNVNNLYQPTIDRHPTVQYGNIPRPIDVNRPSQNQAMYQQMERPNQQQQQSQFYAQSHINSLFPTPIDPNKVKIRPNAHKVESMEEIASEEAISYDEQPMSNQQAYSYSSNANNNNEHANQYQSINVGGSSNNSPKHPYMPRPHSVSALSSYGLSNTISINNKPKFPSYGTSSSSSSSHDGTQLVNVGGNFIRYDVFQNTILPMLGHSQNDELNNIEVITCATGVRQPNTTDCTRYYVCSKKDGKVLSYSCPPYTAFNSQTRICDAHTYAICTPSAIASSYTVTENKRMQLEAFQALQEAKRRREQAIKAQSIANLLQQYDGQLNSPNAPDAETSQEKDMLNAYVQQAASMASNVVSSTPKSTKKRKYYCKEGDKIPDQTSIYSYFVCYKNAQGMMKGHKMSCSKGLLFCPKTTLCTLSSKCA